MLGRRAAKHSRRFSVVEDLPLSALPPAAISEPSSRPASQQRRDSAAGGPSPCLLYELHAWSLPAPIRARLSFWQAAGGLKAESAWNWRGRMGRALNLRPSSALPLLALFVLERLGSPCASLTDAQARPDQKHRDVPAVPALGVHLISFLEQWRILASPRLPRPRRQLGKPARSWLFD